MCALTTFVYDPQHFGRSLHSRGQTGVQQCQIRRVMSLKMLELGWIVLCHSQEPSVNPNHWGETLGYASFLILILVFGVDLLSQIWKIPDIVCFVLMKTDKYTSQVGMTLVADHSGRVFSDISRPSIKDVVINREARYNMWKGDGCEKYISSFNMALVLKSMFPKILNTISLGFPARWSWRLSRAWRAKFGSPKGSCKGPFFISTQNAGCFREGWWLRWTQLVNGPWRWAKLWND